MRTSMDHGVIYLLTGPAHAARLVVSLWSLRRHYSGPVTIYTTHNDSHEVGRRCQADRRLRVDHCQANPARRGKNLAFLTKLDLLSQSPYAVTLYLDADTLVAGRLDPLFEAARTGEFAATQFAGWIATGRTIRKRIEAWRNVQTERFSRAWLDQLIAEALQPLPAVNGGVFAFSRQAALLPTWRELAYAGRETFICDEVALQLLLPRFPHQVLDCRFNCSPIYASGTTDVRLWHFHGEKHVSRAVCRQLWWPSYRICVAENVAQLADWTPGGDSRLAGYLAAAQEATA